MRLPLILCMAALLSGCLETTRVATNVGPEFTPGYRIGRVLVFAGRFGTSERQAAAAELVERLRGQGIDAAHSDDLELPDGERLSRTMRLRLATENGFDNALVITRGSERTRTSVAQVGNIIFSSPSNRPVHLATLFDSRTGDIIWSGQFRTGNDPAWGFAKVKYDTAEAMVRDLRERGLLGPAP